MLSLSACVCRHVLILADFLSFPHRNFMLLGVLVVSRHLWMYIQSSFSICMLSMLLHSQQRPSVIRLNLRVCVIEGKRLNGKQRTGLFQALSNVPLAQIQHVF